MSNHAFLLQNLQEQLYNSENIPSIEPIFNICKNLLAL